MSEPMPKWQIEREGDWWITAENEPERVIGVMVSDSSNDGQSAPRAAIVVACVNACLEINPRNPLAVAEHLENLWGEFRLAAAALSRANCRDACDDDCRRRRRLIDAIKAES